MTHRTKTIALATAFAIAGGAAIAHAAKKHDKDAAHAKQMAEVGKPAPNFTLTGYDGKTYELSSYKDKIVVLEWFNKDCPVCQAYMGTMKDLYGKYNKKGIVWLAIDSTNNHNGKDNAEAATEKKIAYPILSDFDGTVGHEYGAKTTPHMFVINKGTLAYMGAVDDSNGKVGKGKKNYVSSALDELLAGKDVSTTSTKSFGCSVKYKK